MSKTYPVKTERIRAMKKKWMIVIISLIFIVALIGAGGKMFTDKKAEQKEAEKIEAERMSVEALKNTFANIKSVEIEKSGFDIKTGAFDVFVKMTNQKNESVNFSYTYWSNQDELGSIGIINDEVQIDGVTENRIRIIYSNKEEGEV